MPAFYISPCYDLRFDSDTKSLLPCSSVRRHLAKLGGYQALHGVVRQDQITLLKPCLISADLITSGIVVGITRSFYDLTSYHCHRQLPMVRSTFGLYERLIASQSECQARLFSPSVLVDVHRNGWDQGSDRLSYSLQFGLI